MNHSDAVYAPLYYYLGTSYGNLRTHGYSLRGTTEPTFLSSEEIYRKWCLQHHLFLNPLNDLPQELSCFTTDSLQLPDMVTPIEQIGPPKYYGMFNQLKQEYVYSPYLCFAAFTEPEETHFADKETQLIDMLDYPQSKVFLCK